MILGGLSINIPLVNVFGGFILGMFSVVSSLLNLDANNNLFLSIGFCGSLTSLSSFGVETRNLFENNYLDLAIWNILANVFLSLGALVSSKAIINILWG